MSTRASILYIDKRDKDSKKGINIHAYNDFASGFYLSISCNDCGSGCKMEISKDGADKLKNMLGKYE